MKNSQFFREKSAKSFRSQNSLDMEPAVYLPARKGGRHLKDMDGMTYALSKFFVKIFKNSEKIRGPPGVP